MSLQAEGHHFSQPENEESANARSLHTRVSELLDNAIETASAEGTEPGVTEPEGNLSEARGEEPGEGQDQSVEGDLQGGDKETLEQKSDAAAGANTGRGERGPEDASSMPATVVKIRGRPGGVLVEVDEDGAWPDVLRLLDERLGAAEGFFRGGRAVLDVGPREVYEDDLRKARDLLARHDMILGVVRSTSDRTLQSSLLLGLSTSNVEEAPAEPDRAMAPVVPITQPKSPYFVHNGTLRSGQVLRKAESIVVVGDVNPGAKIISGGDVMVWGRLRGVAHAGAKGNRNAVVAAIEFSPTQLRIASVTAVAPESSKPSRGFKFWKKEPERRPEVAYIADGRIVVEPWDDSRPGRPKIARR